MFRRREREVGAAAVGHHDDPAGDDGAVGSAGCRDLAVHQIFKPGNPVAGGGRADAVGRAVAVEVGGGDGISAGETAVDQAAGPVNSRAGQVLPPGDVVGREGRAEHIAVGVVVEVGGDKGIGAGKAVGNRAVSPTGAAAVQVLPPGEGIGAEACGEDVQVGIAVHVVGVDIERSAEIAVHEMGEPVGAGAIHVFPPLDVIERVSRADDVGTAVAVDIGGAHGVNPREGGIHNGFGPVGAAAKVAPDGDLAGKAGGDKIHVCVAGKLGGEDAGGVGKISLHDAQAPIGAGAAVVAPPGEPAGIISRAEDIGEAVAIKVRGLHRAGAGESAVNGELGPVGAVAVIAPPGDGVGLKAGGEHVRAAVAIDVGGCDRAWAVEGRVNDTFLEDHGGGKGGGREHGQ